MNGRSEWQASSTGDAVVTFPSREWKCRRGPLDIGNGLSFVASGYRQPSLMCCDMTGNGSSVMRNHWLLGPSQHILVNCQYASHDDTASQPRAPLRLH
jgi:hypothetical protein